MKLYLHQTPAPSLLLLLNYGDAGKWDNFTNLVLHSIQMNLKHILQDNELVMSWNDVLCR